MTKRLHLDYNGGERKAYRLPVSQLVTAIQVAAKNDFRLHCVAVSSLWATVELTQTERKMLQGCVLLQEDK